jgi:ribosomal protein S18 acetylase RimI-like enzyme
MEFRSVVPADYESVRQLLAESGWPHRVADREKFRKMIDNTSRTVLALDGDRVVGFARALCDEVSNGYISMVVVAADWRRQGIGRELIRLLIKDDAGITWVLRAGRSSAEFWKSIGFSSSEIAMERLRTG